MRQSERKAAVIEELKGEGIVVDCNPLDEPPLMVGYPGQMTDAIRLRIMNAFQKQLGSEPDIIFGITEIQLRLLRRDALNNAMKAAGMDVVQLSEKLVLQQSAQGGGLPRDAGERFSNRIRLILSGHYPLKGEAIAVFASALNVSTEELMVLSDDLIVDTREELDKISL